MDKMNVAEATRYLLFLDVIFKLRLIGYRTYGMLGTRLLAELP